MKLMHKSFIDEARIALALREAVAPSADTLESLINSVNSLSGLELEEVASLMAIDDAKVWHNIFKTAGEIKEKVYGRRIVLFAPLYLSNECENNCLYCGFRSSNRLLKRRTLTIDEAVGQARILAEMGHKRILLVSAENESDASLDYICDVVSAIYENTKIRIAHVNVAPFDIGGFRRLKEAGIGVYQLFQETYHRDTFAHMHPSGRKSEYEWRINAMDRAVEAGIEDVGLGALFGLYDWRFEVLALLQHTRHLEERFGVSAHTISVPRLMPAYGTPIKDAPNPVSDLEFKKIVAILRLALPNIGIVISTRESAGLRNEIISIGASQISAASRTSPGGYINSESDEDKSQFSLDDTRTLDEVVGAICDSGNIPSFCASCYRIGRTGGKFLELAQHGGIKDFCDPNVILTLKEYLIDYAGPDTKKKCEAAIKAYLGRDGLDLKVEKKLKRIESGERDIYF